MHEGSPAYLPYGQQSIGDDDVEAVVAALRSDFLTTGPLVGAFEGAFAKAVSAQHACACNSGTSALHLAMMALDVGPGDTVIVPSMTFLATANAARFQGARVVFADVDQRTGLMTPATLADAVERAGGPIKVVVAVHLNGQAADMESISAIAKQTGAAIVEDACHALGAEHLARDGTRTPIGSCSFSDISCFSLHPVKGITTAEGGVATTADAELAERLHRFRSHGMVRDARRYTSSDLAFASDGRAHAWYYEMPEIGWNYRLPDVLSALGISQLKKLPVFIEQRRALASRYDEAIKRLDERVAAHPRVNWSTHAFHLYAVLIDFQQLGTNRDAVMADLREQAIGTQVHYLPVHLQPYYQQHAPTPALEGAEAYYAQCLSLPMFPAMRMDDVDRVVAALVSATGRSS